MLRNDALHLQTIHSHVLGSTLPLHEERAMNKPTELFVLELATALQGLGIVGVPLRQPLAEAAVSIARSIWPR